MHGGRLLLIGTSNLDAQMPVIWNIGAIAQSGHPRALDTVRRILLASSAIPGAFSPVLFDVTLDGQPFQELHVDGGAFAQVFLYPASVSQFRRERLARRQPVAPARAWVIRNGRLDPEWASVDRRTLGIVGRAITAMIAASGYNDVLRIYAAAERDGVDYNLAFIGRDFTVEYDKPFDQAYMRPLYRVWPAARAARRCLGEAAAGLRAARVGQAPLQRAPAALPQRRDLHATMRQLLRQGVPALARPARPHASAEVLAFSRLARHCSPLSVLAVPAASSGAGHRAARLLQRTGRRQLPDLMRWTAPERHLCAKLGAVKASSERSRPP